MTAATGATGGAPPESDTERRVVLITGGSSGIGQGAALAFAESGFKVAISGRNKERLNEVLEQMRNKAPDRNQDNFLAIEANFENIDQVESLIDTVVAKFHRLDVLVNNAGYLGHMLKLSDKNFFKDFQSVLQVNLLAATRLVQMATPHLIKSPRGVLINVSSVMDRVPNPAVAYCVSKAGLTMLTKTLANELEGTNVRVVAIAPGPISTRISPIIDTLAGTTSFGRMGTSEEVANLIKFLESEKASFVHGCTIDIDGGYLARVAITSGPYSTKVALESLKS